MGETTSGRLGLPGAPARLGPLHPSDVIARFGTPMFCLDVVSEEPLDVVFSGINRAQSAASGMEPGDLVGRRPGEALPPRAAANVMANYRRCLEERRPIEYEEGHEGRDGQRWYRTTLGPWTDGSGRIVALVGSAVEITDRRRRSDEDAETIARLRRLSDEVRTFASMAAHDVRSPLATVESLVELVLEELRSGDVEEAASLLRSCGEMACEARGQMDDLLRHATSLGVEEPKASRTDLDRMGRDLSAVVDPQGRLRMSWPRETVEVDAVTLQLVLRNLMSNAARHCSGRVAVVLDPPDGPGRLAAFTVRDDGPGFDHDPFARDDPLRRHETVRGFGLAAARYLIEGRGGTIAVVRDAPGGAVRFTIPCRVLGA